MTLGEFVQKRLLNVTSSVSVYERVHEILMNRWNIT
jgi:hypothetical protein